MKCTNCRFETNSFAVYKCPRCSSLLIMEYENTVFRVDRDKPGIWRYSSLLPPFTKTVSLGEGLTPVVKINNVFVKNERFNPTGSYTDRAASVTASYLLSSGVRSVVTNYVEDYTKSIVHYLRYIGIDISIYIDNVSRIETSELLLFINNNIGIVTKPLINRLVLDYANPLTIEGLKTIIFEIYEKKINVDRIIIPSETGLLAFSLYKGLLDLNKVGVDTSYEIIAVTYKNREPPLLRNLNSRGIRIIDVSVEEAIESLKKLAQRGLKTKLLSAICYSIAESLGNAVAIVTAGYKPHGTSRSSEVKRLVKEVLVKKPLITAYTIWKEKPIYSLRAVYKAVRDMELKKEICFEIISRGRRKVKLYKLC